MTTSHTSSQPLLGQNIVVTGASEGIGFGIAARFVDAGANVAVAARRPAVLTDAVAQLQSKGDADQRILAIEADICDKDSVAAMFDRIADEFPVLNGLVANAGSGAVTPFLDVTLDEWHRSIDLNLTGTFMCVQAAARAMVTTPDVNRSIVVTSSIRALGVRPSLAPYATAKAGLNQLVRVAAYELAPTGVRVNALSPGITATPLARDRNSLLDERAATVPMGRAGTPADMAEAALFLCAPGSEFVTGTNMVVDGGESLH
ncbi:SDR family NAD(P)-dependent oxidoreductase [Rhodococcus wratislaviensis]|uniref:Putative oxidoreductase n=1 Tax=Rhodococcus wratislaviensis NBRC 100605 TaxID=1219028 RepID=X0PPR7_RHOWR|nr:SDR family oxidoreductase [Rhodococcus wratislaviensis]GAF44708.1 putative oxidoreductase [Rhodococcus wratislaviensis NBRC 100605]